MIKVSGSECTYMSAFITYRKLLCTTILWQNNPVYHYVIINYCTSTKFHYLFNFIIFTDSKNALNLIFAKFCEILWNRYQSIDISTTSVKLNLHKYIIFENPISIKLSVHILIMEVHYEKKTMLGVQKVHSGGTSSLTQVTSIGADHLRIGRGEQRARNIF